MTGSEVETEQQSVSHVSAQVWAIMISRESAVTIYTCSVVHCHIQDSRMLFYDGSLFKHRKEGKYCHHYKFHDKLLTLQSSLAKDYFYNRFQWYESLQMWRLQFLDKETLLIKLVSDRSLVLLYEVCLTCWIASISFWPWCVDSKRLHGRKFVPYMSPLTWMNREFWMYLTIAAPR